MTTQKLKKLKLSLLDKAYVSKFFENPKEFFATQPYSLQDFFNALTNVEFLGKFLKLYSQQINIFLDKNNFLEKVLEFENKIGLNLLTFGLITFFNDLILTLFPTKKDFIAQIKKKHLELLNEKFVKYGTDKLIEFYKEIDLGHEEDAIRKTRELIKKIDSTLDLRNSENSITFFSAILIFKTLETELLKNEHNKVHLQETKRLFQIFEALLYVDTSFKQVNFFTKRKIKRQQKVFFDTVRNFNYTDYRNELQLILFQKKYNTVEQDFLNFSEFRKKTVVGYMKENQDFRYQYLKHLTEILDNFKVYLQQQIAPSKPDEFKLKVNMSVEELCLLFKELNNLKPNIFETKHETELYRFISESFITKGTKNISEKSIKNKFYEEPKKNTVDFWKTHISTIQSNLKKY